MSMPMMTFKETIERQRITTVDRERSISAEARAKPAPPKVVKKDFIPNAYHEDVVEEAMAQQKKVQSILMHQKQASDTDGAKSSSIQTTDNRATWAQNLIAKRPIRALAKEFAANKKIKPTDFTTEAYEKNDAKNRYNDIICIDATRVILKERPPDDDYIHASWMTMPDGQKYICTQGPLLECVGDFWHMVTSEKSKVIVMLCNFNEGKHEKCCIYLPKEKKEVGNFGGFTIGVKNSRPDPFEGIKHTELDVKYGDNNTKSTVVHHLAYFDWPDHTAPLNPAPTIGMFKLGRTLAGAIDYAAQKVREKADASMIDVVRDLRCQRYQAIQSAIQYVFLHICLLELFAGENAVQRDSKFNEYMDSYVVMIKRYNKKVEAKQRERSKTEEK
ncbi:Protein-tyrosine phosphatase [Ancylostoma ceylanicum]|uniref:Protein-tyrosine phosphatase n=1 Tax=Ancylostoma ceylanicum TaxID=53326 RepID=A0A0D6MBT3_9BILA|nr:Protein-tyrosine phosphatase [Ancylostoma ceylanicum]